MFLYSEDICICLVGQIDFIISETCLRVAIYEALLQCNLLVLFSSIIQKTGAMCEKTGIFKPLRIQLKGRSCFRSKFSSIYDMPLCSRLLASIGDSYDITFGNTCDCD